MLNKWLNPIPIVREYIAERRSSKRSFKKKTTDQRIKELQRKNLNKKRNGRINYGYDDDGNLLAHSVSPYSKDFFDTIEPGIKDLVLAFLNKNYLTLSSCESHCLYSKRYVTLVFKSKAHARQVKNIILKKIPSVRFIFSTPKEYMNMEMTFADNGSFTGLKKSQAEEHAAIDSLNSMFCRSYTRYYILEIRISEEVTPNDTWWSSFKKKMYKLFKMKRVTKKLVNLVESSTFPIYPG